MKRFNSKWLAAPLALALLGGIGGLASAQDGQDANADQEMQQNREWAERLKNMTPEQRQQLLQQVQQQMNNMTPEQREAMQQRIQRFQQFQQNGAGDRQGGQGAPGGPGGPGGRGQGWGGRGGFSRVDMQRQILTTAGITDEGVRDTIIEFIQAQETARQALLQQARTLATGLSSTDVTNEERSAALAAFREASAADKKRYATALAELDQKIKYTQDSRLETVLTLMGVVGDEVAPLGGSMAVFNMQGGRGQGGRGGRGGQGGRGGRGGQGGPGQGGPGGPPPAQ